MREIVIRYESGVVAARGQVDEHGHRVGLWLVFFETGELCRSLRYPRRALLSGPDPRYP